MRSRRPGSTIALTLIVLAGGCVQKMADQPAPRAYGPSAFFLDGTSARPIPTGVVARESATAGDPLVTYLRAEREPARRAGGEHNGDDRSLAPEPAAPSDPARFVETFPFRMTLADLRRGQERFTIFCTVCHGPLGDGKGKIVERGYLPPPNFHTDNSRGFGRFGKTVSLREAPSGYLFAVVSRGYGAMPSYGSMIPPADRWRIIAYVRALQLSQYAPVDELTEPQRRAALRAMESTP